MKKLEAKAWCFKWLHSSNKQDKRGRWIGPSFLIPEHQRGTRSAVWDCVIDYWKDRGQSRANTRRRVHRKGGRVVKVRIVER